MRVSGTNSGINAQQGFGGMQAIEDVWSRGLKKQIADAQKKLQDLSSDENMSMEEKMKRRQEIQKQINDLNNQLRQHQMDVQREARREKSAPKEDVAGDSQKIQKEKDAGMSQAGMKALISADTAIGQAKVQGSVANQMEGRAGVLESEIKMDSSRGSSTESKEEELEDVKQKAAAATAAQGNTLRAASELMAEAAKKETETSGEEKKEKEEEEKANTVGQTYTSDGKIVNEDASPLVSTWI